MGAPGFDNSPMVDLAFAEMPKPITFVYPYYENPWFLEYQLGIWASYPKKLRDSVQVIIVDDGSPDDPAEKVLGPGKTLPLRTRLFRIEVDVRWNWLAARNIGMHHATGWCMLTDMDHVVTPIVGLSLIGRLHKAAVIYRFSRREHTGQVIHPHPNSMFMTQQMFWHVGGYDESLSGFYGTDGDWRRRCAERAMIKLLPDQLVRYEYQKDSSTVRYLRKQPEDAGKKAVVALRGKGWMPKTLSFPYHEVIL